MGYKIILLLTITLLNGVLSYLILGGKKSVTKIYFALVTISVAFWSVNLAFFISTQNIDYALMFANLYYIAAAGIPVAFFYFSLFFLSNRTPTKKYTLFFIPFLLLAAFFVSNSNFLITSISYASHGKDVVLNFTNYIWYIAYFLMYVFAAYYSLVRTYISLKTDTEKAQVRLVIAGTLLAYVLGTIFNLFLPIFGTYDYIWLGPVFTLIMVGSIGYGIAKHKLFEIQVVAVEVLTVLISVFIFIRALTADNILISTVSFALLVFSLVFGLVLVRSIKNEISIREQIEELVKQLSRANTKLRKVENQKSEFVSIASHQLRTPLTAVKGYASMLLEGSFGDLDTNVKKATEKIFKSSQRLVLLVEDFLTISRIEQGRIKYQFDILDVDKVLKESIEELSVSIEEKEIGIELEFDDNEKYTVKADYTKLKQVFNNIIDNSIKYTKEGIILIRLSKNKKLRQVRVSISDTGMGMNENTKDGVFDMFQQFEKSGKHTTGSGFGLYVANEIIKAHNGEIRAESKGIGKGSTFFIDLPYEPASKKEKE